MTSKKLILQDQPVAKVVDIIQAARQQTRQKVAPAVRQLNCTHNRIILNPCKSSGERKFYLRMAIQEKWNNGISKYQPKSLISIRIKQL